MINDVFVTKFSPAGQLPSSTFIGGAGAGYDRAIAVDDQGAATVTGYTSSANWPTTSAFQSSYAGSDDAFIATAQPGHDALILGRYSELRDRIRRRR